MSKKNEFHVSLIVWVFHRFINGHKICNDDRSFTNCGSVYTSVLHRRHPILFSRSIIILIIIGIGMLNF